MKIHKEGYTTLLISAIAVTAICYLTQQYIEQDTIAGVVYGFTALCFLTILQFFRSSNRDSDNNNNLIYAPADGEVVVIEEIEESKFFNEKRIQVSIFMSPLNVHVNWYPVSGKIEDIKYYPGSHLVAWNPKSSFKNEMTNVIIRHPNGMKILVKQIAGALARRIVCYAKTDQKVKQGEELGFIKFGSRVDVLLPVSVKIKIKIGDKVRGCESVIAEF